MLIYLLVFSSFSFSISIGSLPIHPVLQYYELLHPSDFRHEILSTTPHSGQPWARQIHYHCLGRSFGLHLEPRVNLFSRTFQVHLVNSNGDTKPFSLNTNRFYHGHLIGDNSSVVAVHLLEGGMIIAHINTLNETYYIEPAHFHFEVSHDSHMVTYRRSDSNHSHLAESFDSIATPTDSFIEVRQEHSVLKKQAAQVEDSCSIVVVADYRFYQFLRSSESNVIDIIVSRFDAADRLSFRSSKWIINANGDTITGIGIQIGKIIIHTEPSSDPLHYNSVESDFSIQDLLRRFSRNNWSDYCLAHLITHRVFPSRKLGLAYIASTNIDETGGICSTRVLDASTLDVVTYNTGVSIVSTEDRLLLPSEAELVIAHEIGHSWGSPHDPGNNENCAFNYLMNEFAQDDSDPKHRTFSPCSLVSIGRVLVNKAGCFESKSVSTCGNFIIDNDEECDEGDFGSLLAEGQESCCTSECRLKEAAVCSDVNHLCCMDCQIAPIESRVCHVVGNISRDCTSLTTCNGISRDCPEPNQADLETRCVDGICLYNDESNATVECVSFCKVEGLQTCSCTGENQCLECCATDNGECQPLLYQGEYISFPNGVFCTSGFCQSGVCVDSSQDLASQLWTVITALDIDRSAQFIKQNIVGFVLLVVTIIWVPGSLLFHYLCDVKRLWRRCLKRSTESPDNNASNQVFVTQSSWTMQEKPELKPLLSVDEDDVPVAEPEDDLPLPDSFKDYRYSNDAVITVESTM